KMQRAHDTPLLFDNEVVKKIADKHNKSAGQVLLRWATQRGVAVIPKSNNKDRLAQNLDVCSFDLAEDEIKAISALDSPPLGPLFSPRANPPQRLPLHETQLVSQANHRSDISIALHKAFVPWLLNMGRLQPYLYEDPELYTMLVAFGLAVQRGDVTRFPNIKARATSLVLKRHVTSTSEIRNRDMPAEKLVQRLAVDVTQNSQALVAIDMAKKEEEYLLQEATCVANFLVTYTLPLSRHLKE
ncbi:hypothetical protein KCU64_g17579, partial [Aureobasidium melanogenum]